MKKTFTVLLTSLLCIHAQAQYNGTASVTQGEGDTTAANIYTCTGGRVTNTGSIVASDSTVWLLPAAIRFTDTSFPNSSDLYNQCVGHSYANAAAALAALTGNDIVDVDAGGELYTAYVFADNYFEMYVNGVPVGKDNVPYTPFNSSIIRFRASRPFTVAMLLVDWEEHLGVGCETNATYSYYVGDGGMVMVIKDSLNSTVARTNGDWRAQTYYTSPVKNLGCVYEVGNERRSDTCSTTSSNAGQNYYGLHWPRPTDWTLPSFIDSVLPLAYTYTNATVGVNNKPAYTNFTSIFDDPADDAQFIWSSNLILDNEVLVRYTVPSGSTGINAPNRNALPELFPNPASGTVRIRIGDRTMEDRFESIDVIDVTGKNIWNCKDCHGALDTQGFPSGNYVVKVTHDGVVNELKLLVR